MSKPHSTDSLNQSNLIHKQLHTRQQSFQLTQSNIHTYHSIFDSMDKLNELRPDTMLNHLRIGLKPELGHSITLNIRDTLYRQVLNDITDVERLHINQCSKPSLISIQPYNTQNMNLIEKLYIIKERLGLDGGGYGGELGISNRIHRLFTPSINGSTTQYIGSEQWTVDRCGMTTTNYHIRYMSDNDVFWTKLVPTTTSSLYDTLRISIKDYFNR